MDHARHADARAGRRPQARRPGRGRSLARRERGADRGRGRGGRSRRGRAGERPLRPSLTAAKTETETYRARLAELQLNQQLGKLRPVEQVTTARAFAARPCCARSAAFARAPTSCLRARKKMACSACAPACARSSAICARLPLAELFDPGEAVTPTEWAAKNLVVPDGPRAGEKFSAELTPYLREPLEFLFRRLSRQQGGRSQVEANRIYHGWRSCVRLYRRRRAVRRVPDRADDRKLERFQRRKAAARDRRLAGAARRKFARRKSRSDKGSTT
jgi:hypothetical protein